MACTLNAATSSGGGIISTADATGTLELQSAGSTQLTVSSTGAYGTLRLATAKPYNWNTLTNNTFIDFENIPAWVKRITVMFNGVSTNGTSLVQVQIGDGAVLTSGYVSSSGNVFGTNSTSIGTSTTGFVLNSVGAALRRTGHMTLTLISGNTWVSSHAIGEENGGSGNLSGGGTATLSATLDRVRITTTGSDVFDAGTINILYEG